MHACGVMTSDVGNFLCLYLYPHPRLAVKELLGIEPLHYCIFQYIQFQKAVTKLTTLGTSINKNLMCQAHVSGVKMNA